MKKEKRRRRITADAPDVEPIKSPLKSITYLDDNGNIKTTIHDGSFSPPEQTPPEYLSFEADKDNTSIFITSTMATAPNIEYSTDGSTFSELPHTTSNSTHTFETITLENKGDKVYLRGENTALSTSIKSTIFKINGGVIAGGVVTTLLDKKGRITELPDYALARIFEEASSGFACYIKNVPSLGEVTKIGRGSCEYMYLNCVLIADKAADMSKITYIGEGGCTNMYYHARSLKSAADMNNVTYIGGIGCAGMYSLASEIKKAANIGNVSYLGKDCFKSMYMRDTSLTLIDNGELTFEFPELPITDASGNIYSTPQDVVDAMTYDPFA